jgi:hypothetical protein
MGEEFTWYFEHRLQAGFQAVCDGLPESEAVCYVAFYV